MKRMIKFTTIFCLLAAPLFSMREPSPLTDSCNAFACDLYHHLSDGGDNVFFSPYSVNAALAMTYAGARGITAQEMQAVFHNPLSHEDYHPAFAALGNAINKKEDTSYAIEIANKLFIQQGLQLEPAFEALMDACYEATFAHADFVNNPQQTDDTINSWTTQKTCDQILNIASASDFNSDTHLTLVNAIYFKGNWAKQFDKKINRFAPFFLNQGMPKTVPMMRQTNEFLYMENEDLQMLELPYQGDDLSMCIVLPKENNIKAIEKLLTVENLKAWTAALTQNEVLVKLPKFKLEANYKLHETLPGMGMPSAFNPTADFSGIGDDLYIAKVLHNAFIELDEEGTEAAAATTVVMAEECGRRQLKPTTFIADHPFLFFIKDRHSGVIFFMGRLATPPGYLNPSGCFPSFWFHKEHKSEYKRDYQRKNNHVKERVEHTVNGERFIEEREYNVK